MDNEFFIRKIKQLSDERLRELIQLKTKENQEIIELAEKEARNRGIDPTTIDTRIEEKEHEKNRTKEDKGINWMGVIAEFLNTLS